MDEYHLGHPAVADECEKNQGGRILSGAQLIMFIKIRLDNFFLTSKGKIDLASPKLDQNSD